MHKPNKITTFAAELLCFLRKKHNTLTINLHATWQLLQPTYLNELPDLAYRDIPSVDAIEEDISTLLALIMFE